MKRKFKTIVGAAAASAMVCTVLAQQPTSPPMDQTASAPQAAPQTCAAGLNGDTKTSKIIGLTVKNCQYEKLGKLNDLLLDVESGRIVQVILASGGFLGIDGTLTPVPPDALRHEPGQKYLLLDVSQKKFKGAPKFDSASWNAGSQSNEVATVYGYYGERPYCAGNANGNWSTNSAGVPVRNEVKYTADAVAETNAVATGNSDGTWPQTGNSIANRMESSGSALGYVQRASKLVGSSVWNLHGEKLGTVKNFIVYLPEGRIVAVIVSTGEFIGMEAELSAIPPTALRYNGERDRLQLDVSRDVLASSPHFKANEWPDFSQREYMAGVDRAYNITPYFKAGSEAADNTRQNVRDRDGGTLTPLDQGSSRADVNITTQIRKAILASTGMSVNGQNVKIVTINGHVTLRGPVNTNEEKQTIGEIADRIAQPGNVDNELNVQLVTSN